MKQLVIKSLMVAVSFMAPQIMAATPTTPAPTKSKVPLVNLGQELKGIGGPEIRNAKPIKPATAPRQSNSSYQKTIKNDANKPSANQASVSSKPKKMAHWSYSGKTGPRYWGELSADNLTCKIGKNQSPIDLRDKAAVGTVGLPQLDVHYRDVPLKIINNGHTLQVNYPLGSYIQVGGHRYELMQFHFHTPSEHKKEGFNYPMEVQIVHKDGDGNFAVMAILFQEGEENEQIQTVLDHLPKVVGKQKIHRGARVNPVMFIPGNTEFYKYSGSLTTPPCTEGVYWMVFKKPIEASAEQIQAMNEVMGENSRPVKELNARALLKSWADQVQEPAMYEFY